MRPDDERHPQPEDLPGDRVPAFNVPTVVLLLIAIFAMIHFVQTSVLSPAQDDWSLLNFAFFAGCYGDAADVCAVRDRGAGLWSPLSHAFLHADWTHFGVNSLWMLAFGTPVARRIGPQRFLAVFALGSAAGALLFYLLNPGLVQPLVGASGAVSALMGAAGRFALVAPARRRPFDVAFAPLASIGASLRDRTVIIFIAVFFITNFALGTSVAGAFGSGPIAWEAHIGGFLFGFLCFGLLDRPPRPEPAS